MRRLIWGFALCTYHIVGDLMSSSNLKLLACLYCMENIVTELNNFNLFSMNRFSHNMTQVILAWHTNFYRTYFLAWLIRISGHLAWDINSYLTHPWYLTKPAMCGLFIGCLWTHAHGCQMMSLSSSEVIAISKWCHHEYHISAYSETLREFNFNLKFNWMASKKKGPSFVRGENRKICHSESLSVFTRQALW